MSDTQMGGTVEPTAEQIKFGELVAYLRNMAGSVPPTDAPAYRYSALAFESVADYIEAILHGNFDSLPWGVAENLHSGRGRIDG